MDKRVYTINEAGALLRLSKGSVYKLLRQQKLSGFRAGNVWRIPVDNLNKFCSGGGGEKKETAR